MNTDAPDDSRYPDELIEGHEYDGIREYDNPTPAWLLWIFYGTVAWSIFYIAALGVGWIDDYDAQLEAGKERIAEKRAAAEAEADEIDEQALTARIGDAEAIDRGQQPYDQICATCHGEDGSGEIGPAFTDDDWVYGDDPMTQFDVTKNGRENEGMPAHDGQLTDEEIADVVAYINSF